MADTGAATGPASAGAPGDDYSVAGQKLGPKGRQVRERLKTAARVLMASHPTSPPTLTAIAQAAEVKLTAVYRYYADVGALYLDAMQPLREEMAPVAALLAQPWAPGTEYREALAFATAHFDYWLERRGALFVRNGLAEHGDPRFIALRATWANPLFQALGRKLAAAHGREVGDEDMAVAAVVASGMERTTTIVLQQTASGESPGMFRKASQQTAIARILTTLLRHDYLES
ncbi:TetR/AcrR family transcriptional regulator [Novosphingobium bradum]|uniref:TetR/AcrR family transcriptional regulator n=1 Tax=Novosphingobium bradum TaxID=1737444 RepID=A0ABV7IS22_9SPHN